MWFWWLYVIEFIFVLVCNLKFEFKNYLFVTALILGVIPGLQLCKFFGGDAGGGNPYFLYTFLVLFLPFIPLGIAMAVSEGIKKNRK